MSDRIEKIKEYFKNKFKRTRKRRKRRKKANGFVYGVSFDGGTYTGILENSKPHGRGTKTCFDGTTIEGTFSAGELQDDSVIVNYSNGDVYKGEFKNGEKHGVGKLICNNGDVYEGEFENGKKHGVGKLICNNGDVYDGKFENGKKHGVGSICNSEGYFIYLNGIESVEGVIKLNNGYEYKGEMLNLQPHGYGTARYIDGGAYEGNFKNGKNHGFGELTYTNGDVYKGKFENGKRHDKSAEIQERGVKYPNVEFRNGFEVYPKKLKDIKAEGNKFTKTLELKVFSKKVADEEARFSSIACYADIRGSSEMIKKVANDKGDFLNIVEEHFKDNKFLLQKTENPSFRLFIEQHGGRGGCNDIGIDAGTVDEFYKLLEKYGIKEFELVSHSCNLGEALHFQKKAPEAIGVETIIHTVPEGKVNHAKYLKSKDGQPVVLNFYYKDNGQRASPIPTIYPLKSEEIKLDFETTMNTAVKRNNVRDIIDKFNKDSRKLIRTAK